MKAQAFLQLVKEMLTAQQDYFTWRRHGDLVKAKGLEKQAWAVVKEGRLEPDVVTTVEITNEPPPALDFVEVQRPNVPEQKPLFGDDHEETK